METIYRFIYRPAVRREKPYRFPPRAKASRGRRTFKRRRDPIEGRRSIHERPQAVASREEFGHWEGDLMQFRTQRGNLLTLCERKSRFSVAAPLKTKTAEETGQVLMAALDRLPPHARRTITFDNGGEFAHHRQLTDGLGIDTYFCDPHSPWQRGSIESTNGIFRWDMPRNPGITDYSPHDIDDIAWAVYSTPRKCLGYNTPAEAFHEDLRWCT